MSSAPGRPGWHSVSVLPPFRLLRPRSVWEALGLVDYDRMAYAGGT